MPRYLVERTFPDGLAIPQNDDGAKACSSVVAGNLQHFIGGVLGRTGYVRNRELEFSLPGRYDVSPAQAGILSTTPGVREVLDI